ncbi:ABC transporter permease subunit [Siculibacillus lacustris]|uniref:ABC transporter permease subunit n=1 Tax=Siculibacillus lacustris TaxID=1549641 RepID=A0A4Q9VSP1_9HYPH|nr:ABC transporter permease subunit [Siculibacillus lacustris]
MAYFTLIGFGPRGWGAALAQATLMTLAVSIAAFGVGIVFGMFGCWAKLSGSVVARGAATAYTTILRGIPDLLVIYLLYFGGSQAIGSIARLLGHQGFFGLNGFVVGTLAVGIVSGAYETEVLRGAYQAIPRGELEAARVAGMGRLLMLRRIIAPQTLRFALPGMGNVWQLVIKESALISVVGLVEIMNQTRIAVGSTGAAFSFYATGAALFLVVTTFSGAAFRRAERWAMRGMPSGGGRRA